jgi:hypothetical protein
MYKYMIIGLTLLTLGYAGYYFNTSGGGDLLTKAITQTIEAQEGVTIAQLFAGEYECAKEDGCDNPVKIILVDDTTFELLYTEKESDEETLAAQGTWGVGNNNKLILLVDKRFSLPAVPSSIYGIIDTLKIKELSKKKQLFTWMTNPIFTRTTSGLSEEDSVEVVE